MSYQLETDRGRKSMILKYEKVWMLGIIPVLYLAF